MSEKRDKEIAAMVRNMQSLGDPKWKKTAIAHLQEMLQDPKRAGKVAKVVRAFAKRPRGE